MAANPVIFARDLPPLPAGFQLPFGAGVLGWFAYNGIVLQVTSVRQVNRQAIYNGPDYLYTRHTVHITAYYSPAYTSYFPNMMGIQQGVAPGFVRLVQGIAPTITDVAIRDYLLEPRQQLLWIMGPSAPNQLPTVLLASPDPSLLIPNGGSGQVTVDANNGPIPIFCNVSRIHGTKTFQVEYIIQTDLNQNYGYNTAFPPPLLSNRWSEELSWDEQYFTTRVVHGRAVFRTDALALLNARPDDYRDWLFFPVPNGFKRMPSHVQQNPEGTMIDYTIVDQEQQISLTSQLQSNFGVVKIEGVHSISTTQKGFEFIATEFVLRNGNAVGEATQAALQTGAAPKGGKLGTAVQAAGEIGGKLLSNTAGIIWEALPRQMHHVQVRLWGDSTSNRDALAAVGLLVIANRLQRLQFPANGPFLYELMHSSQTDDFMKKFVELTFTINTGPIFTQNFLTILQQAGLQRPFTGLEYMPGITQNGGENPYPRGAILKGQPNKSRGTYLASLVNAVLSPSFKDGVSFYPPANTQATTEPPYTPRTLP